MYFEGIYRNVLKEKVLKKQGFAANVNYVDGHVPTICRRLENYRKPMFKLCVGIAFNLMTIADAHQTQIQMQLHMWLHLMC